MITIIVIYINIIGLERNQSFEGHYSKGNSGYRLPGMRDVDDKIDIKVNGCTFREASLSYLFLLPSSL